MRELLSGYFDDARAIIGRHGGTIEKFIGDAVMAVWGVPIALENDAERAVRASLELVDAVHAFGEAHQLEGLAARVGVVTGQAAAMDSVEEGIVVGDRVNTAARIQALAEPGTVYVDETTRAATSAAIAYRDAGEHTGQGQDRAGARVAGRAGDRRRAGRAPRSTAWRPTLVGRDSELRLVKELFHSSTERRGARLVSIVGPAGVGKSRLAWEFDKYVDGLAVDVLLAPRPVPLLRRRRRLLGARRRWCASASASASRIRTTWCADQARQRLDELDRDGRGPSLHRAAARPSCSAPPTPTWHATTCSPAGGCSSSGSPSASPSSW